MVRRPSGLWRQVKAVEQAEHASVEQQLVVFQVGNQSYGVDISQVLEIITRQPITRVPRAAEFIEGVINLRGKVIPVIDLGKRFSLASGGIATGSHIVVMDLQGLTAGILVDGVSEVLRLDRSVIEPPSKLIMDEGNQYISGVAKVEDRLIIILNLAEAFGKEEKASLAEIG